MLAAVSASISTPVGPVVFTVEIISIPGILSLRVKSKLILVRLIGWHKGISSEVLFAPCIPAIRATFKTSPFFEFQSAIIFKVSSDI